MRNETPYFANEKYFNVHPNSRSIQENFDLVPSFIQEVAVKHIPSNTSRYVSSVHWITTGIKRMIRKRNKTHAKAKKKKKKKKTGKSSLKIRIQELSKEIKSEIKKEHDLYVNNLVGDIRANPRNFHRYTNIQSKDNQAIPSRKKRDSGGLAETESDQAEEFNGWFIDVFTLSRLMRFLCLEGQPRK